MRAAVLCSAGCVVLFAAGCPTSGSTPAGRSDSRGSVAGRVVLENVNGLNDMSRVRVDLGRGEGGLAPNDDGTFDLTDLEPDVYTVAVTYTGGLTPDASRSAYLRYQARAVLRAGASIHLGDMRLQRATGTVRGTVGTGGGDGESSAGAVVELTLDNGEKRRVEADMSGTFEVLEVPVGTHSAQAQKAGYATAQAQTSCAPGVVVRQEEDDVVVAGLSLAAARAGFTWGAGEVAHVEGDLVCLSGTSVTANVQAGYLRLGRAWLHDAAAPEFAAGPASYPSGTLPEGRTALRYQFADGCGYESPIYAFTALVDGAAPDLSIDLADGATVVNTNTVSMRVEVRDALSPFVEFRHVGCSVDDAGAWTCDGDLAGAAFAPLSTTAISVPLPAGDGRRGVRAQARDCSGNISDVVQAEVRVDATAPLLSSVVVPGDAAGVVYGTEATVRFNAVGATQWRGALDTLDDATPWQGLVPVATDDASTTYNMPLSVVPATEGARTFHVQLRDDAGNVSTPAQAAFRLSTRGRAQGVVTVEGELGVRDVTLSLGAQSAVPGDDGRFAFEDAPAGNPTFSVVIGGAQAARYVAPPPVSVTIRAGETALLPEVRLAPAQGSIRGRFLKAGAADTQNGDIRVSLQRVGADPPHIVETGTADDGRWALERLPVGQWNVTASAEGFLDAAVTGVGVVLGMPVTLPDTVLPRREGDFLINGGAPFTNRPQVLLGLSFPSATQFVASEDPALVASGTDAPSSTLTVRTLDAAADEPFTLAAGEGPHAVYVRYLVPSVSVPAGEWTARVFSASITLDTVPPVVATGDAGAGSTFAINGDAPFTRAQRVGLDIVAVDDTSGVATVLVAEGEAAVRADAVPVALGARAPAWTLEDAEGRHVLRAWLVDRAGNETPAALVDEIYLDRVAPVGVLPVVQGAVNGAVPGPSVVLDLSAADACLAGYPGPCTSGSAPPHQVLLSNRQDMLGATWEEFASPRLWTLLPGDGARHVYARFRDGAGNETMQLDTLVNIDVTPPASPVVSVAGSRVRNDESLQVTASATGATEYRVGTPGEPGAWTPYPVSGSGMASLTLPGLDGQYEIVAEFRDGVGNTSAARTTVILDNVPPALFLQVPAAPLTASRNVAVLVQGADGNGLGSMVVGAVGGMSATSAYSSNPQPVTLTGPSGTHVIRVTLTDAAGNSATAEQSLVLDVDAPSVPGAPTLSARAGYVLSGGTTNDAAPRVDFTAGTDVLSPPVAHHLLLSTSAAFTTVDLQQPLQGTSGYVATPLVDGTWHARIRAVDAAGNTADGPLTSFTVDTAAPADPVVVLAGGAAATSTRTVALSVTCAGGTQVRVSVDGALDTEMPQALASATSVMLPTGEGAKTVLAACRDAIGNESNVASAAIELDTVPPQLTAVRIVGSHRDGTPNETRTALRDISVLTDTALGAATMVLAEGTGTTCPTGTPRPYASSTPFSLAAGADGTRTVRVCVVDAAGNVAGPLTDTIALDATPPSCTIAISGRLADGTVTAGTTVGSTSIQVTSTCTGENPTTMATADALVGLSCATATYGTFATPAPAELAPGDGAHNLVACFRDDVGNTTAMPVSAAATLTLDQAPPSTPLVILASGAESVSTAATTTGVMVSMTCVGGTEMRVAMDGILDTEPWEAVQATFTRPVPAGDGEKVVKAQCRDALRNASAEGMDTIRLDTDVPVLSSVTIVGAHRDGTPDPSVTALLDVQVTVVASGEPVLMAVRTTAGALDCATATYDRPFAPTFGATLTTAGVIRVCLQDAAGNRTAAAVMDSITVDQAPPSCTATLQGFNTAGAPVTGSRTAQRAVNVLPSCGTDIPAEMAAVDSGTSLTCATATYLPFASAFPVTLSAGDGAKNVNLCFRDAVGNTSTMPVNAGTDITLDTTPPSCTVALSGFNADGTAASSTQTARTGITVTSTCSGSPAGMVQVDGADTLDCATASYGSFASTLHGEPAGGGGDPKREGLLPG